MSILEIAKATRDTPEEYLEIPWEEEVYHLLGEGVFQSEKHHEIFTASSLQDLVGMLRGIDQWLDTSEKYPLEEQGDVEEIWERWRKENPERYEDFLRRAPAMKGKLWAP